MQILIICLIALILLLLIVASRRPSTFTIERSIQINAPAETIFPFINDFRLWAAWSPWEQIDPNMERTYNGAESGVGAKYAWLGNKKIGQGNMNILESNPPSFVKIDLQFLKPFQANNVAKFKLKDDGGITVVVWTMSGPCPLISKLMGLFMDMDKMIGTQFELGLHTLKKITEQP